MQVTQSEAMVGCCAKALSLCTVPHLLFCEHDFTSPHELANHQKHVVDYRYKANGKENPKA